MGDKAEEGRSYGSLGEVYCSVRQSQTAIEYQNRCLEIAKEVGDKTGEGVSYYHLGTILRGQKKFKRAIELYQRYLEISKEVLSKENSVPSNTVFIALNGPCVYFWVFLCEDNIQMRKVHVNNYKYENELQFFIQLQNKTALKEIGRRDAVPCENPSPGSSKEEEVAKDVIRVDVRCSQSRALQKLHDIIVSPIADLIKGSEITFVPEGPFCLVPYAALEDSRSSYLSDSFSIRVLPSLTTLQLIHDCPAEFHMKRGALLVGDPCFKHIIYQGGLLVQLPGARKEVEMIGRILKHSPLIGEMATKEKVLKRMSSVALVHIAAHGKKETGEVILAPSTTRKNSQPEEKDYLMTMKDVLETGLRARLVVLSCCHTACGKVMAEGVVGIARAFLGAGAKSVVVTLWAIDGEGTLEFMSFFYDALAKGKKASEALQQAMKCMRESEMFKEVQYWAPFVLIGDDVSLDFKEIQTSNHVITLFIAFIQYQVT